MAHAERSQERITTSTGSNTHVCCVEITESKIPSHKPLYLVGRSSQHQHKYIHEPPCMCKTWTKF